METLLTPSNITFILGLLAVLFSIYNYFKNPQLDLDRRQIIGQIEVDNKAAILARDLEGEKHATERRFTEMGARVDKYGNVL